MRRQFSGVVKYCCPACCWPANTSHSRNSVRSRPSPCRMTRPVTSACALIARQSAKVRDRFRIGDALDEGRRIDRRKQAGAAQIVGDDAGHIARDVAIGRRPPRKSGQRDRHRLHVALRHVELEHGLRRAQTRGDQHRSGAEREHAPAGQERIASEGLRHRERSLFWKRVSFETAQPRYISRGSKVTSTSCQMSYFAIGIL